MTKKHHTIVSASIFFVSVVAALFYAIHLGAQHSRELKISGIDIPKIEVPGHKTIERINYLEEAAKDLYRPRPNYSKWLNMSLFGVTARKTGKGNRTGGGSPSLTFVFTAGNSRYCVIDGSFYPEGKKMPDGGRIIKIEKNRVLISRAGTNSWLVFKK